MHIFINKTEDHEDNFYLQICIKKHINNNSPVKNNLCIKYSKFQLFGNWDTV